MLRDKRKLILMAFVLVVLFIIILIYVATGKKDNAKSSNTSNEKISTNEVAVDLSNTEESYKLAKDYTNLTSDEKAKVYEKYGYDNVSFTEQGILVRPYDSSSNTEDVLYTDIWPDTELTNKVKKPDFGDIYEIENGESYLYIMLSDVKESDLKAYAKDVKEEYSEEIKTKKAGSIYRGKNKNGARVIVSLNEEKNIGIIHYDF